MTPVAAAVVEICILVAAHHLDNDWPEDTNTKGIHDKNCREIRATPTAPR
jgi:hypothetical protein